jgi:hypothetical protein
MPYNAGQKSRDRAIFVGATGVVVLEDQTRPRELFSVIHFPESSGVFYFTHRSFELLIKKHIPDFADRKTGVVKKNQKWKLSD